MRSLPIAVCLCVGLFGFAVTGVAASSDAAPKPGEAPAQTSGQAVNPKADVQPVSQDGKAQENVKADSGANAASSPGNSRTGPTRSSGETAGDKNCWGRELLCNAIATRKSLKPDSAEYFVALRNERRLTQAALDDDFEIKVSKSARVAGIEYDLNTFNQTTKEEEDKRR